MFFCFYFRFFVYFILSVALPDTFFFSSRGGTSQARRSSSRGRPRPGVYEECLRKADAEEEVSIAVSAVSTAELVKRSVRSMRRLEMSSVDIWLRLFCSPPLNLSLSLSLSLDTFL